jgi:hypothetical protein
MHLHQHAPPYPVVLYLFQDFSVQGGTTYVLDKALEKVEHLDVAEFSLHEALWSQLVYILLAENILIIE